MRVAMYYNNRDIRIEDREVPKIGPGELLVKVISSGICGSDVLEWYRVPKAPLVLGHEIAGEIVEVGGDVTSWKVGDRVFVSHHIPCDTCRYCLAGHHTCCDLLASTNFDPGGFSEYLRVPLVNMKNGVFRLPDNLSDDHAVFVEPLACVYRGQSLAGWKPARSVLVLGAGISGMLHVQLARVVGASLVVAVDVDPFRLELARNVGADAALAAGSDVIDRFKEINGGRLADMLIVATGAPQAIQQAFRAVDRGGNILFFAPSDPGAAVDMPFNEIWRKEIAVTTSYGGSPRDISAAIDLLASGRIQAEPMITHRLPLEKTVDGFGLVAQAHGSLKVIIHPHGS